LAIASQKIKELQSQRTSRHICSTFIFAQPHKDHHRFDYICNQMTAKLKYLLLLIVSLCYLQAAFEVNTDTLKNTWGDEYDTYIHADNNATQHILKVEHKPDFALLPDCFLYQEIETFKSFVVGDFRSFLDTSPHKLFLKNCSLLI
jgi:hypothetical protein